MEPIEKRFSASSYGWVEFEGTGIACAFGGDPGHFTAAVMIEQICSVIGMDFEGEIERIQGNHLLEPGLYLVPYQFVEQGKRVIQDCPSIALTRLHTWLALIPPQELTDAAMRAKLVSMQEQLTDLIYAYFGRPLLPADMLDEDDQYLDEKTRKYYEAVHSAAEIRGRIEDVEQELGELRDQVKDLSMTIHSYESGENIDRVNQDRLRAMIDILSRKYAEKHGDESYGEIEKALKEAFNWRYYRAVPAAIYPDLVRECVRRYQALWPKGSKLPPVFAAAMKDAEQRRLF